MVITQFIIHQFGKFKNRTFTFSPITLFYGKNEAGKSTLFDAIFQALVKPDGRLQLGKKLASRYGNKREIEVIGNIPDSVDQDEFINLHSLKAGEIGMDFSKGGWLENIKKQLFSGGIDPNSLAKDLSSGASNSGSTAHMKKKKIIDASAESLRLEIDSIRSEKLNLMKREENVSSQEVEKDSLAEKIKKLEIEKSVLESRIQLQENIQERKKFTQLYKNISTWKEQESSIALLQEFNDDTRIRIQKLEESKIQINANRDSQKERIKSLTTKFEESRSKFQESELNYKKKSHLENLARSIKQRVEETIENPVMIEKWEKNSRFIPLALVSFIAGIAMLVWDFSSQGFLFWGGLLVLIASFVLFILSFSKVRIQDENKLYTSFQNFKREWMEAATSLPDSNIDNLIRLRDYLFQFLSSMNEEFQTVRNLEEEMKRNEEELNRSIMDEKKLKEELERIDNTLKEIFSKLGIRTSDEFFANLNRFISMQNIQKKLKSDIEFSFGKREFDDLFLEAKRKLEEFDEKNVPGEGLDENAFKNLKNEYSQILKSLQLQKDQFQNMNLDTTRDRASVEASLGPLSEKLLTKELQLLESLKISEGIEKTRRAHEMAENIFQQLGAEANDSLEALGEEIQKSSEIIFNKKREIKIINLNGGITMEDEGGNLRLIDELSLGTRDSFYIAAKLSLCEKRDPDLKLFILDEPFLSLDTEREKMAIEILKDYVVKKGWQIIIFSKEERLGSILKDSFQDSFTKVDL
ncbi:MAG: AAA family ATPase [Leptospira sp.]|nr:AAA family ATPase [Leptospira sp.]